MKDRRKHKKSKKAREMNKIEENQRIKSRKGIDADSKEVSYTCQEHPDPDIFFCQMTGRIPLNLTVFVCIKNVRILSDTAGGLTLSFYSLIFSML